MELLEVLKRRRSVRGFLPNAVPRSDLEAVFLAAQQAPSWCNIQPWRVWLLSGEAAKEMRTALVHAAAAGEVPSPDVPFPANYPSPYQEHRRACGKALYSAMGVARDDHAGRHAAWLRNFDAFGAPHVAIVTCHRDFGAYGTLDVGCWLQSLLLALQERGIASCAMASLATYPQLLRDRLGIAPELQVLCGIAIGYEDDRIAANGCRTERNPVVDNLTWVE
jgi:nitroreductase